MPVKQFERRASAMRQRLRRAKVTIPAGTVTFCAAALARVLLRLRRVAQVMPRRRTPAWRTWVFRPEKFKARGF